MSNTKVNTAEINPSWSEEGRRHKATLSINVAKGHDLAIIQFNRPIPVMMFVLNPDADVPTPMERDVMKNEGVMTPMVDYQLESMVRMSALSEDLQAMVRAEILPKESP